MFRKTTIPESKIRARHRNGGIRMATESFYEDLVIGTPEAAANFTVLFEENKPYISSGTVFKEASAGFLRDLKEEFGCKELRS